MIYLLLLLLYVSHITGYSIIDETLKDDGNDPLFWPEKYTVKAIKMSFTSDITENFVSWKTNMTSRVDYNDGAVKSITKISEDEDEEESVQYQIHPIVSDTDSVETICSSLTSGDYYITLEEILPTVEDTDYEYVGQETIVDIITEKYQYIDNSFTEKDTHTLWVAYKSNDLDGYWEPVRYEILEYNNLLGLETKHEVWYFSEFSTEFDEDVFDVEEFDCDSGFKKHTIDSEAFTKDLLFVNAENKKHVDHVFNSFKNKFDRHYANENEHEMRKGIFKKNMRLITSINRKNLTYKLGVNQFADRTHEEMMTKHTGLLKRPEGKSGNIPFPYTKAKLDNLVSEIPLEYDARVYGLVGPIKNQEDCGSCWTYGSTAAVEAALARVNGGRLMSLSNQALVDCAWAYGAAGCNGGSDTAAYEWMMKHGLPTEEDYGPYKNKDGYCHIANMTTLYTIRGYTDVTPFSNNALKAALINYGPLSVSVEVTDQFGLYSRGIFYEKDCGPTNLNHEVTLVGYGEQDGELYWVLKNSWGTTWGNSGFMQISARDNNCGVTTEPTYVVF